MSKRFQNLQGQRFGKLVAIEFIEINKNKKSVWRFKCDCGNEKNIIVSNVKNGRTSSCGCEHKKQLSNRVKKHGYCGAKLYTIWIDMKDRCFNPNNTSYSNYGGRNIKVCNEWKHDFKTFKEWAFKNGYKEGLSIERINNNKDYSPNNCKFISFLDQNKNKRSNKYVTIDGETKTISEWSRVVGINRNTISRRISKGIQGKDLISKERIYTSK